MTLTARLMAIFLMCHTEGGNSLAGVGSTEQRVCVLLPRYAQLACGRTLH
jgi:hypothetical protein